MRNKLTDLLILCLAKKMVETETEMNFSNQTQIQGSSLHYTLIA